MKYLLSSVSISNDRLQAIKDSIIMAFRIEPRDIKFDEIPCLNKTVDAKSDDDRDLILKERLNQLLDRMSKSVGLSLQLLDMTVGNTTNISIKVGEQILEFKL